MSTAHKKSTNKTKSDVTWRWAKSEWENSVPTKKYPSLDWARRNTLGAAWDWQSRQCLCAWGVPVPSHASWRGRRPVWRGRDRLN